MSLLLCTGATLTCSFGAAPSVFSADPLPGAPQVLGAVAGAITAISPANIPPFGACQSMANPSVASATSAAMGVLTPMPCTPVMAGAWAPPAASGSVGGVSLATVSSKCACSFGGVISVAGPVPGPVQAS
jgi:hypothetical protein